MFWIAYRTPDVKRLEAAPRHSLPLPPLPTVEVMPPAPHASLRTHAQVSAGNLDNRALNKPFPLYPALAGAARASGTVFVEILVDEAGKVISARAISGHPLLRQTAERAAYGAVFTPLRLSGEAVTVYGTLSYNFVLP
jgi:TonB family protein